jgi:4-hydroxyphenylpyruvate dioxygenase
MTTRDSIAVNPLGIEGIDHLLFYVYDAEQTARNYASVFGFVPIGSERRENASCCCESWVLRGGTATLVLSSEPDARGPIFSHTNRHGESVKDIAFNVQNAEKAFYEAVRRGACPVAEPVSLEDEHGTVTVASVAACGDVVHSFVDRSRYQASFVPGYAEPLLLPTARGNVVGFDHFALGVEAGSLAHWAAYYKDVFGFWECHEENVTTSKSGMRSLVVRGQPDDAVFPILEPVPGAARSQIQVFLDFSGGAGVQHAALRTDDIVGAVDRLTRNGIEFLATPGIYYDALPERVGRLEEDIDDLRRLHIMVDRDATGYLYQAFTKPLTNRPTFFIELIQRKGATGFGSGNIRALFEAVERSQAATGTA